MFFKKSCLRPLNTLVWDSYEAGWRKASNLHFMQRKSRALFPESVQNTSKP